MVDVPVRMPKMSMTMTEGEVLTWKVLPGQRVSAGDVVCEVQTDKVDMEVEAPAGGVVREILVMTGVVAVGTPIALIDSNEAGAGIDLLDDGPATSEPVAPEPAAAPEPAVAPEREVAPADPARIEPRPGPVAAVPRARALAGALGIDLRRVRGTGPAGVVTVADVSAAGGRAARDVRLAAARRMAGAAAVPQLSVTRSADIDDLTAPSLEPVLLAAFTAALRSHPELTRCWVGDSLSGALTGGAPIGVSLAVDTAAGTLLPAFADADRQARDALAPVVERARSFARRGRVESRHLVPAVATLTYLAGHDAERYQAAVPAPQSSVLAVTRPRRLAVPGGPGGVAWRRHVTLTLTVDHRVGDGPLAAAVLAAVVDHLTAIDGTAGSVAS